MRKMETRSEIDRVFPCNSVLHTCILNADALSYI